MTATKHSAMPILITGLMLFSGLLVTTDLSAQNAKKTKSKAETPKAAAKPTGTKPADKSADASAPPADADVAAGKKIYDANGCGTCHAISGKGGAAGPILTATGAASAHTQIWLAEQVSNPKAHNPNSTMPGYATSIKGKDLTSLAVFLVSLKGEPAAALNAPKKLGIAPDPAAMGQIQKMGGLVSPVAENDDHLDINLRMAGTAVNDAALTPVSKLAGASRLDLGNTAITDAGLMRLKGLKNLTALHLEGTRVTDAGLTALQDMRSLEYLNLYNTATTDAGLDHLTRLTNLRHLYVWQTKVTDAGVAKLKKALPQCEIVQGIAVTPTK